MGEMPNKPAFLAWYAMLQVSTRLTERLNAELEEQVGIPLSWFEVLAQLHWAPDECGRMGELADGLLLSRGGVTRLIARMEDAGLVRRETPATDRRATFAHLTDAGREAFARALPAQVANMHRLFHAPLSDQDLADLSRIMGKVLAGRLDADVDWLVQDLQENSK
jgi:DNA-binding MarR family transcriptional regulator